MARVLYYDETRSSQAGIRLFEQRVDDRAHRVHRLGSRQRRGQRNRRGTAQSGSFETNLESQQPNTTSC